MTRRFWQLPLLALAAAGCSAPVPDVPEPLTDAEVRQAAVRDDLWSHLQRYAGESPRDCGQHVSRGASERIAAEDLERSVGCVQTAVGRREPVVAFEQSQGIDSVVVQGLVAGGDGVIFRFWYDSAPCGNPGGCSARFSVDRCMRPSVVAPPRGGPAVHCVRD